MLRHRLLQTFILAVALGVFGSVVFGQTKISTETATRKSGGSINGETYRYKFTQDDFAETPSWNAENGEPPLAFERAAQIARINLPRFVTGAEKFKIQRIHLNPVGDDKWMYNILFICRAAECRGLPTRQFAVIVKMDGTILEPKRIVEVD